MRAMGNMNSITSELRIGLYSNCRRYFSSKHQQSSKFRGKSKERQVIVQVMVGVTIFAGFVAAPFIGKKLAQRDSEVLKWVPWGDFTVNKHYKGIKEYYTKEDIHKSLVEYQKEMHGRAIAGEFKSYENDSERRKSIYWRPNLSDGPAHPDFDESDDDDDDSD